MGDYGPSAPPLHSTPVGNPSHPAPSANEISVLVTGFGPFKTNLVNASYLIASSLPPSFTFPSPKFKEAGEGEVEQEDEVERRISLHVHPFPIPVAYATVREMLPVILEQYAAAHDGRRPDLIIHIGIASPRPYYSVETLAHRDDYNITDIEGRSGYEDGEKRWREMGLPPVLSPGLAMEENEDNNSTGTDVTSTGISISASAKTRLAIPYPPDDHFLQMWKSLAPENLDLRISQDPGHYLCDFIFYTSLSLAKQQGADRNTLFLHVPGASEDADIERGREIALALIKTMVTCWIDEKREVPP
ncbi:uncharacterized protein N7482_007797 [Penicillium canariense]|uniref:Pyroglutamyl peptidase type I n=1 Tax=Penicillium canariense TaxID=189055 RepID=A0A9W9HXK6_9EURO|nr:uncharacterized protein N7482_007797 [Penicillium canariense]KAJ5160793.1 hypothetical protein N7482_007797 [Penicillium canariense]